jgi:hypothetical protein
MYLPNPSLHPTGSEPAEFIDVPGLAPEPAAPARGPTPAPAPSGASRPLDEQTRLNITRWAQEYISGLVATYNGHPDDIRSVILKLHDETALTPEDGTL